MTRMNDPKIQNFQADDMTIEELRQRGTYVVPEYQRQYCWTSNEISVLMKDLVDLYLANEKKNDSERSCYSLGTIVCDCIGGKKSDSTGQFAVLDGQQRLTTLDLIFGYLGTKRDPKSSSTPKIISRYLNGQDLKRAELTEIFTEDFLPTDISPEKFAEKFEEFLLKQVKVRRIILPMRKCRGEAPRMFEIINLRGQNLSPLDIFKADLLRCIGDNDGDRKVFNAFWLDLEKAIGAKRPCQELTDPDKQKTGSVSNTQPAFPTKFTEILKIKFKAENSDNASEDDDNPVYEEPLHSAPIDLSNLLIMSAVLRKHWPGVNAESTQDGKYEDNADALGVGKTERIFKSISNGIKKPEHVWQLLGAASIVQMATFVWGVYRSLDKDLLPEAPTNAFNQLTLSFFAHNSYRYSGQYWHLLLSAYAGLRVIDPALKGQGKASVTEWCPLPTDRNSFMSFVKAGQKPDLFKKHENEAFALLCQWACCYAYSCNESVVPSADLKGQLWLSAIEDSSTENSGLTGTVFNLLHRFVAEINKSDPKLFPRFNPKAAGWDDGVYTNRWRLYLTDYLVWADFNLCDKPQLPGRELIIKESDEKTVTVKDDFWKRFAEKIKPDQIRIVSRGAVEHWVPQIRVKQGGAKEETINMFGNLALIDSSTNSSLRDEETKSKSLQIIKHKVASNPSIKLCWLADLTQYLDERQVNLNENHLKSLTDFWFGYLINYDFTKISLK